MNHTITLTFKDDGTVYVDPNPLPESLPESKQVLPKDTVTWIIEPQDARGREVQVLFEKVYNLSDPSSSEYCNPLGIFSSLSVGAGEIVGTVRYNPYGGDPKSPRRFLYSLFEKGERLELYPPIQDIQEAANSGGIDIPMTPGVA